jgi:hypothetical protein
MIQISLLRTKAIWLALPRIGVDGVGVCVAVSVGRRGVTVLVASIRTETDVASLSAVDVSVAGGADVNVLTGATGAVGILVPLNLSKRKNPPARTAMTRRGTITKSALNDLFGGRALTSALMVGAVLA